MPPISEDTQKRFASASHATARGRAPTSTFAATAPVSASITCAMFVVSEVLTT